MTGVPNIWTDYCPLMAPCGGQDFEEEQGLVARLIHRLRSDDPGQHYALLQAARKRLSAGGARRLRHTLPPIAFAALDIVRRLAAAGPASREPSQKEVSHCLSPLGGSASSTIWASFNNFPDVCHHKVHKMLKTALVIHTWPQTVAKPDIL